MREHIVFISHSSNWPGITPLNVWDMTYGMWRLYVAAAEFERAERRKEARRGR